MRFAVQRKDVARYLKMGVSRREMYVVLTRFDIKYAAIKEIKQLYSVGTTRAVKILAEFEFKKKEKKYV